MVRSSRTPIASSRFIYAFLGLGAFLCVVTCAGHIAAETVNGCCFYLYMGFIVLLIMVEGGVVADIFLNRDWKEDFPEDPSGVFHHLSKFMSQTSRFTDGYVSLLSVSRVCQCYWPCSSMKEPTGEELQNKKL